MDETAEAMWWGYNMMERFRDYPWTRPFRPLATWGLPVALPSNGGGSPRDTSRPTTRSTWCGIPGTRCGTRLPIGSRTLSLSAEEVFESIRTLHVQTALQDNQFSGQRLGWFDVTGIERAVWGARDNWEKFWLAYRLLKGIAVVQDQNYSTQGDRVVHRPKLDEGRQAPRNYGRGEQRQGLAGSFHERQNGPYLEVPGQAPRGLLG